jgi:hypothetical protein
MRTTSRGARQTTAASLKWVCEMVDPFITKCPFNLKAFCESLPNKVITL